ncbi:MAG TPA: hypothetical protein GX534_08570 [Thermoanaerobacterales bacterium]|jgi:hypothetical protein|nr:hypothetical protein [Thermoanaerobacterales bacterium]
MHVVIPSISDMALDLIKNDILNAKILEKSEDGYIIDLLGKSIFARSDLELKVGQNINLRLINKSGNKIVFKIAKDNDRLNTSGKNQICDSFDSPEVKSAITLLSKLNLPITKQSLETLRDIYSKLLKQKPLNDDNANSSLRQETTQGQTETRLNLGIKALNLLYQKSQLEHISFFMLTMPCPKTQLIVKQSGQYEDNGSTSTFSFIVETTNLGSILVKILKQQETISSTLIFEDKKGLDIARKEADKLKESNSLPGALHLKMGTISKQDFFFGELENEFDDTIMPDINIRI